MAKNILFNKGDIIFIENVEGKNIVRQTPQSKWSYSSN